MTKLSGTFSGTFLGTFFGIFSETFKEIWLLLFRFFAIEDAKKIFLLRLRLKLI